MTRRTFLQALAALPVVGLLVPKAKAVPVFTPATLLPPGPPIESLVMEPQILWMRYELGAVNKQPVVVKMQGVARDGRWVTLHTFAANSTGVL